MGEPRFYCEKCQRMFVPWPGRIKCGECGALATRKQVRFLIILNARIENVGKYMSCMVSKVRIIWKQTVVPAGEAAAVVATVSTRYLPSERAGGGGNMQLFVPLPPQSPHGTQVPFNAFSTAL